MEVDPEQEAFDASFIETPAILDKYKGAAGIVDGKFNKQT
jgi:hypothetical protein